MGIKSLKEAWTKIGASMVVGKRTIHHYFSPVIEYDDGREKQNPLCMEIEKKDFKRLYLDPSYFVVETKSFVFAFDDGGKLKSKNSCETVGTILWLQNDGLISANGNELLKFDIDGKITKRSPLKDFFTDEMLETMRCQDPEIYEKVMTLNIL